MIKKLFTALLILAVPCSAHAISEADYSETYRTNVIPFYDNGTFSQFTGTNDLIIKYAAFKGDEKRFIDNYAWKIRILY